jgi:dipeptidyl aminopeptidase/acylaminoacyl peptidase
MKPSKSLLSLYSLIVVLTIVVVESNYVLAQEAEPMGEIVFESDRDGNFEIYLMEANGSNQRNLTQNPAYDTYPIWSPDGNQIAFLSDRDTTIESKPFSLYIMDSNGENVRRMLPENSWIFPESYAVTGAPFFWSPDGTKIAVSASTQTGDNHWQDNIYVIDLQLGEMQQVSTSRGFSPVWSPDGNFIAFVNLLSTDRDRRWSYGIVDVNQPFEMIIRYLVDGPIVTSIHPEYIYWEELNYQEGETEHEYGFSVQLHDIDSSQVVQTEFIFEQKNNLAFITIKSLLDEETTLRWGRRLNNQEWTISVLNQDGDWEIYLENLDTEKSLQLTSNETFDGSPDWRPQSTIESQ